MWTLFASVPAALFTWLVENTFLARFFSAKKTTVSPEAQRVAQDAANPMPKSAVEKDLSDGTF